LIRQAGLFFVDAETVSRPTGNLRVRRRRARGVQLQGYHDGEPGKEIRGEGRRSSRAAVAWRCFHGDVVLVELGISWERIVEHEPGRHEDAAGGLVTWQATA
jgi:hypothetical protein